MLTPEPLAGQSSILLISSNHLMIGLMIFMTKAGFAVAHRFPSCIHCIFLLFIDSFPCLRPSFDSSIYGLKIKTDALALVWPGSVLLSRFHPLHRLVLSNELSLFPSFSFFPLSFSPPISILLRQGLCFGIPVFIMHSLFWLRVHGLARLTYGWKRHDNTPFAHSHNRDHFNFQIFFAPNQIIARIIES